MKVTYKVEVKGLSKRIRAARKKFQRDAIERGDYTDYSVVALAHAAGISTGYWYMVEKGQKDITLDVLRAIEEVLEVDFGVGNEDQ